MASALSGDCLADGDTQAGRYRHLWPQGPAADPSEVATLRPVTGLRHQLGRRGRALDVEYRPEALVGGLPCPREM